MDEPGTVARPYASAVFDLAREEDQVDHWSDALKLLVTVVRDPTMSGLIANPKVKSDELAGIVIDVCAEHLKQDGRNLVRLLAENRRLAIIPDIASVYEAERARAEQRRPVEVTTAYELAESERDEITSAMAKHLGARVDLSVKVDASLLGGVVIRAGDLVIDASLRGRLDQLAQSLA